MSAASGHYQALGGADGVDEDDALLGSPMPLPEEEDEELAHKPAPTPLRTTMDMVTRSKMNTQRSKVISRCCAAFGFSSELLAATCSFVHVPPLRR